MNYEWKAINDALDALVRADAILDVTMEANSGREYGGLTGTLWAVQREIDFVKHVLEDCCEKEDTHIPSFIRADDGQMELPMEDGEGEEDDSALDEDDGEDTAQTDGRVITARAILIEALAKGGFDIQIIEAHDNGDVAAVLSGTDEQMSALFEACLKFVINASRLEDMAE